MNEAYRIDQTGATIIFNPTQQKGNLSFQLPKNGTQEIDAFRFKFNDKNVDTFIMWCLANSKYMITKIYQIIYHLNVDLDG